MTVTSTTAMPRDPLTLFKPAKQVRAFEEVISQFQSLLSSGVFAPGDKLPPERDLAVQLSVSRNTVREALRMLEISGVIELRRGARGGAFIIDPNADGSLGPLWRSLRFTDVSVGYLTQAMRSITMMLLDAATPAMTSESIAALEANIADAEKAEEPAHRSAIIIRFYFLLAEATGNPIIMELAENFCEILRSWVQRLGSLGSTRVLESRRSIIGKLRSKDVEGAKAELDRYLKDLHQLWLTGSPD